MPPLELRLHELYGELRGHQKGYEEAGAHDHPQAARPEDAPDGHLKQFTVDERLWGRDKEARGDAQRQDFTSKEEHLGALKGWPKGSERSCHRCDLTCLKSTSPSKFMR